MILNDDDVSKFVQHFPTDGDLTLQVLKGHLLVEEILRELFVMQLPYSTVLKGSGGTSFNCHQVICLVEAMTVQSQRMPWIWQASKKLNSIRNDLAHQLSPKGLGGKVEGLITFVKKENPELNEIVAEGGLPEGEDLIMIIMAMCSCLSSLKPILAKHLIEIHKFA